MTTEQGQQLIDLVTTTNTQLSQIQTVETYMVGILVFVIFAIGFKK